jgi:hypothetical protein
MREPPSPRPLLLALDWRAMLVAVSMPAFYWVLSVVIVTLFGYPGIACMTPAAWLLALLVGRRTILHTATNDRNRRVWEAGLAGGLLGLIQGITLLAALLTTPALLPEERSTAAWVGLLGLLVGMWLTALLGGLVGSWMARRPG